jgi:hypothetical protein
VFQHDHVCRFAGAGCHFATFDGLCLALLNTKSRFNRHSDITLHVYETPAKRNSGISADGFPSGNVTMLHILAHRDKPR